MKQQSIITILLTVFMSMTGAKAFAHDIEAKNSDGVIIYYKWAINNSELVVSQKNNSKAYSGSVVIPETVEYEGNTYKVTSIGDYAFSDCSGLTSVTIPNSVTSIGSDAFYNCSGLTSVIIPNSVTSIGSDAFSNCSGLTSVTIPNSVTFIGRSAFSGTAWYNNQPNGMVYAGRIAYAYKGKMPTNTYITLEDGTIGIAEYAFFNCSGLTSITIPNSVTFIGKSAFSGTAWYNNQPNGMVYAGKIAYVYKGEMPTNTCITLEDGTIGIAEYAFSRCSGLTSVTIGNSVTSIGSGAFYNCSGLTSVTIGSSVTAISSSVFEGCSGLTSVTIGNSVTSIGDDAFCNCSGLTSVTIPNSVTSIGSSAFSGCSGLISVNIPSSATSIGNSAFFNCSGLTSVTIPNSVTFIGSSAFSGTAWYNNQPNGMVYAGRIAYAYKGKMPTNTYITLEDGTIGIAEYAFNGCSGLTSVTIPNSVTSIDRGAFYGCSGLKSVNISELSFWCNIIFGNMEANPLNYAHHLFINGVEIVELNIPDGVTSIGCYAFCGCSGLISVTIPNSVTKIGNGAFDGCDNLSLVLPDRITKRTIHVEKAGTLNDFITADEMFQIEELTITGELNGTDIKYINEMAGKAISTNRYELHTETEGKLRSLDITNARIVKGGDAYNYYLFGSSDSYSNGTQDDAITPGLFTGTKLESILLPNSVTSVRGMTYWNDDSGTTYMGAFPDCLKSVTIPQNVTSINAYAFYGCSGLTSIKVESGNQHYDSRDDCNAIIETNTNTLVAGCKNTIISNSVTSIGEYSFFRCSGLTSVNIPNSVTSIGERAFYGCSGLTSVYISDLKAWCKISIPNSCFSTAYHLYLNGEEIKDLTIPHDITSIGGSAFKYCSGLTSVTIPNSVTSIGGYAFEGCSGLTSVTIPNSVTTIGWDAFSGTAWYNNQPDGLVYAGKVAYKYKGEMPANTRISLQEGTYGIAGSAFSGCSGLTSVTIPNSVTSIGGSAFSGCSGLTSITIPNRVTSIGSSTFYNCSSLISVTIPNSVTSIGSYAFYNCSGLTSVTIPNNVTSIESYAFYNCSGLTSVTIPNNVTSIGNSAFYNCSGLTSVIIPNNVTSIGNDAFYNCSGVTSVTIPNRVRSIGSYAFYNCSGLTSVTIPNSVTTIGWGAFFRCSNLTSAIIGNGVTSIGSAFSNCNSLKEMILSQAAYDNGIPETVTKFTTYSKNPMRVEVVSKGVVSATMKIYSIDEQGNTNENNCYTVTTSGQTPGQYIKWKQDDENYGIISEKTEGTLTLVTQPAQPTSTTKARLIATVNEADDDQHFGFEWLRNDAPDNMPANKVSAPLYDGRIIGSLGGLNPDIYYKYRPFYKSDAGEMVYGEWIPFLTGDANVFFEPEVHTKEAIVTNDGALLSAVFVEGTEDIQEKGFEYWPKNNNARAVSLTRGNNIGSVIVSGNSTSVTIEGLKAGTEYGYRPYVKTASGITYGEEKTFKTSMFGDVNGDNKVDNNDLKDLVSYIMGNSPAHFNKDAADLNNDNKVNAADIVKMVKILK